VWGVSFRRLLGIAHAEFYNTFGVTLVSGLDRLYNFNFGYYQRLQMASSRTAEQPGGQAAGRLSRRPPPPPPLVSQNLVYLVYLVFSMFYLVFWLKIWFHLVYLVF